MQKLIPSIWIVSKIISKNISESPVLSSDELDLYSSLPEHLGHALIEENTFNALPFSDTFKIQVKLSKSGLRVENHLFGLHPIFYYYDQKLFACSTNLRQLIQLITGFKIELNSQSLLHYYSFGFEPTSESMLRQIHKIPAGYTLEFHNNKLQLVQKQSVANFYKDPLLKVSEKTLIDQLDSCFEKGINKMKSTQLNGISLSGGVDSGYASVKLKASGANFKAYTMSYGSSYTEVNRITQLAGELDIQVEQLNLDSDTVIRNFEWVNSQVSQPCGFNNATMNILFKQAANDGVQTLFDGDGADRLFLGMNRYLKLQKVLNFYRILNLLKLDRITSSMLDLIPHSAAHKTATLFKNWHRGLSPYVERIYEDVPYNSDFEDSIYQMAVAKESFDFQKALPEYRQLTDPFKFLSYYSISKCPEMFFHQPSELQLSYGINAAQAFWDTDLVKMATRIPTNYKLKNKTTKYILRKAAASKIFPEYWQLPKIGLQSSYRFATESGGGREWLMNYLTEIENWSKTLELKEIIQLKNIDLKRILPVYIWYKSLL